MQKGSHLGEHPAFGIDHHIAASVLFLRAGLQNLWGEPEPGFAGAGRADHTGIEIAGVGRVFRAGVHGEKLRPGENNIVFKDGIDEWGYIFRPAPSGRPVFFIPPVFFCLFAFGINKQAESHRAHNADEPIERIKPRRKVGKSRAYRLPQAHELMGQIHAGGQPVGCPQLQTGPANEQVRDVWYYIFLDAICPHAPPPLRVLSGGTAGGPVQRRPL